MTKEEQNKASTDEITIKKSKLKWSVFSIFILFFLGTLFYWQPFGSSKPKQKEGFHRDEKTEEQILNKDYSYKVKQMLDSGMSVAEISRETGLRKDVIRKIKKENRD